MRPGLALTLLALVGELARLVGAVPIRTLGDRVVERLVALSARHGATHHAA